MKKAYILILGILGIFGVIEPGLAATVGNPLDLDMPPRSAILRQRIVEQTLDEYEQAVKIKASFDADIVFSKDLHTTNELSGAELKGRWYMAKLGITLFNRVEPYVKFGTSDLEAKWKHGEQNIKKVDADNGFAWGGGVKAIIWEFEDWGIRLTADGQYRTTDPDVKKITSFSQTVTDAGARFKVDEWQASLLISKKFEIPLKWQSVFIVPYTGLSYTDSNVDVSFRDSGRPGLDNSLFDANNQKLYGYVIGCDIVPSLKSAFSYSIELRLIDEVALSLGGTVKF